MLVVPREAASVFMLIEQLLPMDYELGTVHAHEPSHYHLDSLISNDIFDLDLSPTADSMNYGVVNAPMELQPLPESANVSSSHGNASRRAQVSGLKRSNLTQRANPPVSKSPPKPVAKSQSLALKFGETVKRLRNADSLVARLDRV